MDPTIGSAVRLAGYNADFASVPVDGAELKLTQRSSRGGKWSSSASLADRPPSRGVEIDLGATAKALASDLAAAAAIKACSGGGVLVSLGGDIAVAGDAPPEGWPIQASEDSAAPIAESEETISIRTGGIATSSTTVRRWTRGGVVLHHIIDPATGLPANSCWRTASVVAATCVDANIASTAAIVLGRKAVSWLEANRLPGRLVDLEGSVHRVAGWPSPGANSDLLPTLL